MPEAPDVRVGDVWERPGAVHRLLAHADSYAAGGDLPDPRVLVRDLAEAVRDAGQEIILRDEIIDRLDAGWEPKPEDRPPYQWWSGKYEDMSVAEAVYFAVRWARRESVL